MVRSYALANSAKNAATPNTSSSASVRRWITSFARRAELGLRFGCFSVRLAEILEIDQQKIYNEMAKTNYMYAILKKRVDKPVSDKVRESGGGNDRAAHLLGGCAVLQIIVLGDGEVVRLGTRFVSSSRPMIPANPCRASTWRPTPSGTIPTPPWRPM